jgi:hypothetical protein
MHDGFRSAFLIVIILHAGKQAVKTGRSGLGQLLIYLLQYLPLLKEE